MPAPVLPNEGYRAALEGAIVAPAAELGVIAIDGDDAASFLHGQLSSDVQRLGAGESHWSTYNGPKGRTLATLRLARLASGPRFRALVAADLAGAIAKRLAMFVLRAKARVVDASSTATLLGVAGPRAAEAISDAFGIDPRPSAGAALEFGGSSIIGLGDGRFVIVTETPSDSVRARIESRAQPVDENVWRWVGARSGVPLVTAATSDSFVPQMLNVDALGGISFSKGCYPGQEIVARMRYLGVLKERLHAFRATVEHCAPGTRIFSAAFGDQPCGTVVNATPDPAGGVALLAVVQLAAANDASLALGAPDGPPLSAVALPYPLPAPEPPRARVKL